MRLAHCIPSGDTVDEELNMTINKTVTITDHTPYHDTVRGFTRDWHIAYLVAIQWSKSWI